MSLRRVVPALLICVLGGTAGAEEKTAPFKLGGYVEAYYQWNFNDPGNGLTNDRGFDNRHNSFTLSNVAADAQWDDGSIVGRLTLQVGHTPSTYYLAEPFSPGTSSVDTSNGDLWKFVQQAYVGYRMAGVTTTIGVFLSPIGPESMAVKDDWNWSRSNLFFGLPFYHSGIRVTYEAGQRWTIAGAVFNGWNDIVDNNSEKSVATWATYTSDNLTLNALYFGGVERPTGAPEGRPWRNLFDAHATWTLSQALALILHANGGFEPNVFGISSWVAGAVAGRWTLSPRWFIAIRGDAFREWVPSNTRGSATPIFWPVAWVASGTVTLEHKPHERVSLRLEYRHDQAAGNLFFAGHVDGDGTTTPFVPNALAQDTITLGATSWF